VLSRKFDTQIFAPSKARASGSLPTAKVPCSKPSLASNFVTLLPPAFTIQTLVPSNAIFTADWSEPHRKGVTAGGWIELKKRDLLRGLCYSLTEGKLCEGQGGQEGRA
jgi:hypothetical protein